jgi:hypothetical protein
LDVDIIYEKGAYRLRRGAGGLQTVEHLLVTPSEEASIARLRQGFYSGGEPVPPSSIGVSLEREFGVVLVPSGSGTHAAILSFDVLKAGSSREFQSFTPEQRKALKVSDAATLSAIEQRCTELVHNSGIVGLEDARVVHLGNGNIEVAPRSVEKHLAISADIAQRAGIKVAVAGDSFNDKPMFELSQTNPDVHACLVLYREASLPLTALVQSLVFGEANAEQFLRRIIAAKEIVQTVPDLNTSTLPQMPPPGALPAELPRPSA